MVTKPSQPQLGLDGYSWSVTDSYSLLFRNGCPPPEALHQSGLTKGKTSIHGEPKSTADCSRYLQAKSG